MMRVKHVENEKILGLSKASTTSKFETQAESIQKQVQNYTRRFEEEKRKLFRAQENQREVLKEYQNQINSLQSMKSKKYKTEMSTLNAKIKCMEGNLDKSISAYNEALSKNNTLKNEIDELRKDKKNQMEAYRKLTQKIEELHNNIKLKESDIKDKKERLDKNKESILEIKAKNEKECSQFKQNIEYLEKSLKIDLNKESNRVIGKSAETSDSQPLVKMRLRNLLLRNKEKIKICENYKKNMEKIEQNFEEIRERSGIQELDQIKNTFLKHDEQSIFIAEYISKLNSDLDSLKEENEILNQKIEEQEEKNESYRSYLSGTPEDKQRKIQLQEYIDEKQKPIDSMNNFLKNVANCVYEVIGKSQIGGQQLNFFNYEEHLSELERIINEQWNSDKQEKKQIEPKEDITKYSRAIPFYNCEEIKDRNEEGLLHEGRLRDYANDFWDKKKNTRS